MASHTLVCGAECGANPTALLGHWTSVFGTAPAASTAVVRTGTYAWRFNPTGDDSLLRYTPPGGPAVFVGTLAFTFNSSLPGADTEIILFQSGAGTAGSIRFNNSTSKLYSVLNGTTKSDRGSALTPGTWVVIDFKIDISSTTYTFDWRIDGTAQTQETQAGTASTFGTNSIRVGFTTLTTADMFVDDVVFSVTSGDYPINSSTTDPGVEIEVSRPTGDGTHNANAATDFLQDDTTNIDPATTVSYQDVDDDPLSETTHFIALGTGAAGEYLEWTLGSTGRAEDPLSVGVTWSGYNAGNGTNQHLVRLSSGGNNADATVQVSNQTTQTILGAVLNTAPDGGAWTAAKLSACTMRWGNLSADVVPTPYIAGVLLEVAYATAAGGTTPTDSDTFTLTERVPNIALSASDSATLADTGNVSNPITGTDAAALTDTGVVSLINVIGTESLSLDDSFAQVVVEDGIAEATLAESSAIAVGGVSDSAALTESVLIQVTFVGVSDTGTLTDTGVVVASSNTPSGTDSATLSEVVSLAVAVVVSDAFTAADTASFAVAVVDSDTATLTDSGAVVAVSTFAGNVSASASVAARMTGQGTVQGRLTGVAGVS